MKRLTKQVFWGVSLTVAGCLAAGLAQAHGVYWSVNVGAPIAVGGVYTEVSNMPPVRYVQPQPVYVAPAPVYVEPAPVYVQRPWCPPRVVYAPAPAVVVDRYYPVYGGWRHPGWREADRGWDRHDGHRHHDRD